MINPISVATAGYIPMTPISVMADGYLSMPISTPSPATSSGATGSRLRKLNRVEEDRRITAARMAALLAASEW